MKKLLFVFFAVVCFQFSFSQVVGPVRQKIALFAPLYLDSAFQGASYRYDKTFPKFLNPGLEFYQGAQMALDSLQKSGAPLDVYVYDSRAAKTNIAQRLSSPELNGVGMIIAHASSSDVKTLAEAAIRLKVPFISATLPNDAGVTDNPYFVVLNSTLRSHCEAIYGYLQRYHNRDNIVLFRKNGAQENQIRDFFNDISKTTTTGALRINMVDISNGISSAALESRLDSTRRNVCIVGSLDEAFGVNLAQTLATYGETYPVTIFGMPTWDAIREFTKPEYKQMEVVYTTPFNYSRTSGLGAVITNQFEESINSRPTDMFYRGYETMLRFAQLLLETKKDLASNLTRKGSFVFTQFDIQPVFLNKASMTLDYFENKKLYFIKYFNGIRSVVN